LFYEESFDKNHLYYKLARSCFFDKVFRSNRKDAKIAEEIKSKKEMK